MSAATKIYVLDANAILDYVQDGPGSSTMERLFRDVVREVAASLISVVNLGEVYYLFWRSKGEEKAERTMSELLRLPITAVPVDLPQALKAGQLKALHKIPYVDCIAAALALQNRATLVTADRDFEKLGRQFPVAWLPRR